MRSLDGISCGNSSPAEGSKSVDRPDPAMRQNSLNLLGSEACSGISRVIAWIGFRTPQNPAPLIRGFQLSEPPTLAASGNSPNLFREFREGRVLQA